MSKTMIRFFQEAGIVGKAQCFYEEYLAGGDTYQINGSPGTIELYYKNGIALCPVGQGKGFAALNTAAVLSDTQFDFSDAYILSVGCGGASVLRRFPDRDL